MPIKILKKLKLRFSLKTNFRIFQFREETVSYLMGRWLAELTILSEFFVELLMRLIIDLSELNNECTRKLSEG